MPAKAHKLFLYQGFMHEGRFADIVDGRGIPMKEHGSCFFPEGSRFLRPRPGPPRVILWHHTAGEGNGTAVHKTLRRRGLSVHFTVDPEDGRIIQHADLDFVALHAGYANSRSIGVEVCSRGVYPPLPKRHRNNYLDRVHFRERRFLEFTPDQITACIALARDLSAFFGIPYTFPLNDAGYPFRQVLAPKFVNEWSGHLGHMHVSEKKVDPSPHLMDAIQKAGPGT